MNGKTSVKNRTPAFIFTKRLLLFLAILLTGTSSPAGQFLINFDDLPPATNGIYFTNCYKSLNWVNLCYNDGLGYGTNQSGFKNGMVSTNSVVFNAAGLPGSITNATDFDFLSAYLTGGWRNNLQVRIIGYHNATVLYDTTCTLSSFTPTFFTFNYYGVNRVYFSSFGGVANPGWIGSDSQFVMDNLTVSVVPPAAPTSVSAVAGQGQITLSWTASPGATSYRIKRSLDNSGSYATLTNITSTHYTDTRLAANTPYYYVVSAMNDGGESPLSNEASATTAPALALAGAAFDQLWSTFDSDYPLFVLRPEVDWNKSRDTFRPLATNSATVYELVNIFTQMLLPLRDLHVWMTLSNNYVSVYDPPFFLNANPAAYQSLLGGIQSVNSKVQWAVTKEKIGFLAVNSWDVNTDITTLCYDALEQMRDTRGLIIDVRSNFGGSETLAKQVACRFQQTNFIYAFYQMRNGTNHTDFTDKATRVSVPAGPWRYDRPVILLIGQGCVSSTENFIAMMTGVANVTTMGDRTCGSSSNPKTVQLPLGLTVMVPRWIDYLPDGTVLDKRGFQPQIPFIPAADAFSGTNDALLSAAIELLRTAPVPTQPILGLVFGLNAPLNFDFLVSKQSVTTGYGGLTWSNLYSYNAITGVSFQAAMVSSPNIVYNGFGTPASIRADVPFDLISGAFAAGFRSNLNLQVLGYLGTNLLYERNLTLSPTSLIVAQFGFSGVTSVSFISSGGTPFYGTDTHFAMDDLLVLPHNTPGVTPSIQTRNQADGTMTLAWAAKAGETYQPQYTTNLSQSTWIDWGIPLTTGNYTLTLSDPSTNQQKFYRLRLLP